MARRRSSADDAGRNTRDHTEEAARHTSLWVERIARLGYSAKGVVYVVMGVLAVLAAVNAGGGSTSDQNGAFRAIEVRALAFYTGRGRPRRGGPGPEGSGQTYWLCRERPYPRVLRVYRRKPRGGGGR